ncbi:RidA family protein [Gammaproteobacteria bacterium]|nr:RidA family protein [Gammaproteobacteria bacterium]
MGAEVRVKELGLEVPDYGPSTYWGATYGKMRPFHIKDKVLYLSGQVPMWKGEVFNPGRLGATVNFEEGREAARITGLNCLAGVRQALGSLDHVKALIRSLNFVVCEPDYYNVHEVSSGMTDLFAEVWGDEIGIGCRATIGVQSLAGNNCFETWTEFEIK